MLFIGDKPWQKHGPVLGSWSRAEDYITAYFEVRIIEMYFYGGFKLIEKHNLFEYIVFFLNRTLTIG